MASSPIVKFIPIGNCPPNKMPLLPLKNIGSTSTTTCFLINSPLHSTRSTSSPLHGHENTPVHPSPSCHPPPYRTPKTIGCTRAGTTDKKKPLKRLARSAEATRCKRRIDFAYDGLSKSKSESIQRRNERERNRVKQVNVGFETLREHLPIDNVIERSKMSKVETLRSATSYIQHLRQMLNADESRKNYEAMQTTFAAASNPIDNSEQQYEGSFRDLLLSPGSVGSSGRSPEAADWTSDSPSPSEYTEVLPYTDTSAAVPDMTNFARWFQ